MFSALLLIVITVKEIAASIKWDTDSKIVGGNAILDYESIPFIVSIQYEEEGHTCGGSLLSPIYVLSACHCLADIETDQENIEILPTDSYKFVAGLIHLSDTAHAQKRKAKKFHVHPRCRKTPWTILVYDFSVGEMEQPFEINAYVQPFKLLSADSEVFSRKMENVMGDPDSVCLVAGWGVTERGVIEKPVASNVLKAVRMFVIPEKKCQKVYATRNPKFVEFPFSKFNQMCTISYREDASDCQGDSGGPFFCGEYVIGVISYGFECGSSMPNVYTSLTDFVRWFTSEVQQNNRNKTKIITSDRKLKEETSERINEEKIYRAEPRKTNSDRVWKPEVTLMVLISWAQFFL